MKIKSAGPFLILIFICSTLCGQNKRISTDSVTIAEEIFTVYETPINFPQTPACDSLSDLESKNKCFSDELMKSIYNLLEYPQIAQENKIEGKVIIKLDLDKISKIYCVQLVRDLGAGTGKEALRVTNLVLQNMLNEYQPCRWKPTKSNANPIRKFLYIPIHFQLD